ncbi:MAG: acyl-CoA thioesterase [Rhodospirillaceae bacterium]|jgi:4-hydroxybenzoyl-CoA thioesterase|nr:acyl-CoA thioesterase [Rhodospirillaceae bacterium]
MAVFQMSRRVRFADTDPAGIVYFPRYFVMTNDLVEEWFADGLDLPYRKIFEEGVRAVPLLRVEAKFSAPSRLGDMLDFSLAVSRLGTKSFGLNIAAHCAGETRLVTQQASAWARRDGGTIRAEAIPPEIRARMEEYLENP